MDANIAEGRRAVRHFASGVAVLTTVTGDGAVHGTTVSAVTAISREPLLIGVCLRTTSSFVRWLAGHGRFTANVLRCDQHDIARWFADPQRPAGTAQFRPVRWRADPGSGAPVLADAVAHFSCRRRDRFSLGDHDLIVADVLDGAVRAGSPLLSFGGRLHDARLPVPETELTVRSVR
jgi:flavin reductase (DIM6/NTAB) family NADH-FMN oxidoreductase RutF